MTTKNILITIGALAGVGGLAYGVNRLIKKRKERKSIKQYETETYGAETGKKRKRKKGEQPPAEIVVNLADIVDRLAHNLGTMYPSYDPRNWTENDQEAYEVVLEIPLPLIGKVKELYSKKYKSNLVQDLARLLPAENWNKIKNRFIN